MTGLGLGSLVARARRRKRLDRSKDPFVVCENLVKIYRIADLEVMALQGLDLTVGRGELMAVIGASGSGKSTLLNILGGLDQASAGRAIVGGLELGKLSFSERDTYKRDVVGFVWQSPSRNLVPYLTALENVELPMVLSGTFDSARAKELLEAVGLRERMRHKPEQMSGGEQQRVAIAIALANRPSLVLADEPTGSLDSASGEQVIKVLRSVRDRFQVTVILVTHDLGIASSVDRFVRVRDGKVSTETVRIDAARGISQFREAVGSEPAVRAHEEYIVLDSAGRMQLPPDIVQRLGIKGRVKLDVEGDRIVVRNPD